MAINSFQGLPIIVRIQEEICRAEISLLAVMNHHQISGTKVIPSTLMEEGESEGPLPTGRQAVPTEGGIGRGGGE